MPPPLSPLSARDACVSLSGKKKVKRKHPAEPRQSIVEVPIADHKKSDSNCDSNNFIHKFSQSPPIASISVNAAGSTRSETLITDAPRLPPRLAGTSLTRSCLRRRQERFRAGAFRSSLCALLLVPTPPLAHLRPPSALMTPGSTRRADSGPSLFTRCARCHPGGWRHPRAAGPAAACTYFHLQDCAF